MHGIEHSSSDMLMLTHSAPSMTPHDILPSRLDGANITCMDAIKYRYEFRFKDGREESFNIVLDPITLDPLTPLPPSLPKWTRLDFHQCDHCPLDPAATPYCPQAGRLAELVERMQQVISYHEVEVKVVLDERTITRDASAQEGISALMGIITASSGCPHTAFFKPMARFHLPFANTEETLYRAASMYMLGQYYRWQGDLSVDMDLDGLKQFYHNVSKVNIKMAARIRAEQREDSAINALVLLDMFAQNAPDIDEILDELKPLFTAYMQPIGRV